MQTRIVYGPNVKADPLVVTPSIVRITKFTEEALAQFRIDFQIALNSNQGTIPIVIDSYGGYVYSLLGMIDAIKDAQSQGIIVPTYCASKAMSCGAILFSCGTEGYRFMSPYGYILVHQVRGGAFGKTEEVEIEAAHMKELNDQFLEIMSKNCGKKKGYWADRVKENGNADIYLTPKQCVEHNLANEVRTPSLEVKITQSVSLI
jgi:ATP-dependent Clp endopeptidase proteolytic subunit ClpP